MSRSLNYYRYLTVIIFTAASLSLPAQRTTDPPTDFLEKALKQLPTKVDSIFYEEKKLLIYSTPTVNTYSDCSRLTFVLWNLNRLAEMEILCTKLIAMPASFAAGVDTFLLENYKRINSNDTSPPYYRRLNDTYDYNMNSFHMLLARKYIKNRDYQNGFHHLMNSKKYPFFALCGRMYTDINEQYNSLEAACLQEMNQGEEIIKKLIDKCFEYCDARLIMAIRKLYSKQEIYKILQVAENSLVIEKTGHSAGVILYQYKPGMGKPIAFPANMISCRGTITLFDKAINFSKNYTAEKIITRKDMIDHFRQTDFYTMLTK